MKNKKTMKYFYSLILSLALVSTISAKTYTIRFDKADYDINVCNGVVGIEKKDGFTFCDDDIEAPALPYSLFRILRPLNATTADYKVSFKSASCQENVMLEANPQVLSANSYATSKNATRVFAKKSLMNPVDFLGDMSLYGFAYASFKITPFLYDVVKQELHFISEVNITIPDDVSTVTGKNVTNEIKTMQNAPDFTFKSSVKDFVINPEELDSFYKNNNSTIQPPSRTVGDPNVEYLIISTNTLAPSFYRLRDWKTQKGVRADIVVTTYIYDLYSTYSPTLAIKKFLYDYYSNGHNLKWVLLAGDMGFVPSPMCKIEANIGGIQETDTTPCDYYYSCFDGSFNWDGNGNGILGETNDGVNLSPYLYVSRAPVSNTTEAEHFVDKVLAYEAGPSSSFTNKIFLTGCWPLYDDRELYQGRSTAHDASLNMYNQYISNNFNGLFLFYFDTLCNPSPYNATNLKSRLNAGQHFVHMYSHGGYLYWGLNDADGNNSVFNSYSVDSLTNSFPMIILTSSCNTSRFDVPTCLGEDFIGKKYGAVVYVGSSRLGITDGRNTGYSLAYNGLFFNKLFTDVPTTAPHRLGSVMAEVKKNFIDLCYSNVNGYRWLQYAINPFGDPEMPIYTCDYVWSIYPTFTTEGNDITVSFANTNCTITMESLDGSLDEIVRNVSHSHTFHNINKIVRFTITEDNSRPYISDYMYPVDNNQLTGPTLLCDSAVYTINNLPAGATVTWNLSSFHSGITVVENSPSANQCKLISTSNTTDYSGSLNAIITLNGHQVATLSKDIRKNGFFYVSVTQFAHAPYPRVEMGQINILSPTYINPECTIFVYSQNFRKMNVTHSGVTPSTWDYNNNNDYFTFSLPSTSAGQTFTIQVRANAGEGDCNNFDIPFIVTTSSIGTQSSPHITISASGSDRTIKLSNINGEYSWNLKVFNVLTGECVFNRDVEGDNSFVSTSGWKSGAYVVKCQVGDKVVTEKMFVKQ